MRKTPTDYWKWKLPRVQLQRSNFVRENINIIVTIMTKQEHRAMTQAVCDMNNSGETVSVLWTPVCPS